MNWTYFTIFLIIVFIFECFKGCNCHDAKTKSEDKIRDRGKSDNVNTNEISFLENVVELLQDDNDGLTTTVYPEINEKQVSNLNENEEARKKKGGIKKKLKKYLLPLLLAYKLKFFTLIPVMIGGLILLTGATGMAGFFFALFAAVMGLKSAHH